MYAIEISDDAQADLIVLRAFDRARILRELPADLGHTPTVATRRRKMLEDLRPSWEHVPPLWQLRVGEYRVFYDVDEAKKAVYIRRVLRKGSKTTGEIV
jgi:mRNA-degrading endonuclease RelE of RelBE toxin-antitoxin system